MDADEHQIDRRDMMTASAVMLAAMLASAGPAGAESAPDAARDKAAGAIAVERDGDVVLIGIDRPETQNRLDPATLLALGQALYHFDSDPTARVAVLYGKGPHFMPGLDIPAWVPVFAAGKFFPEEAGFLNPFNIAAPFRKKPLVVAVHGDTKFGGHELMLAGDIRVAASDTVFSQGEAARAIYPAGGATIRFVHEVGWGNAMRYMLTGDDWSAEEAFRMGEVQAVTPPGEQLNVAIALARKVAAAAPLGVRATRATAEQALFEGELAAYAALAPRFLELTRSQDFQERLRAFQDKRTPVFKGL